jgi:hypothetical protein
MEQPQPDKIFRQKLEDHQLPLTEAVWNRIEGGLEKKKTGYRWLMVAASLVLIAATSALIRFYQHPDVPVENISAKKPSTANEKLPVQAPDEIQSPTPAANDTQISVAMSPAKQRKKASVLSSEPAENVRQESLVSVIEEVDTKNEDIDNTFLTSNLALPELPETPLAAISDPGNLKLELAAEEVNKKYIEFYPDEDATTAAKKTSTLKKLVNKVQSLKTNQDPFGELREKKNELLALGFKGKKHHK